MLYFRPLWCVRSAHYSTLAVFQIPVVHTVSTQYYTLYFRPLWLAHCTTFAVFRAPVVHTVSARYYCCISGPCGAHSQRTVLLAVFRPLWRIRSAHCTMAVILAATRSTN